MARTAAQKARHQAIADGTDYITKVTVPGLANQPDPANSPVQNPSPANTVIPRGSSRDTSTPNTGSNSTWSLIGGSTAGDPNDHVGSVVPPAIAPPGENGTDIGGNGTPYGDDVVSREDVPGGNPPGEDDVYAGSPENPIVAEETIPPGETEGDAEYDPVDFASKMWGFLDTTGITTQGEYVAPEVTMPDQRVIGENEDPLQVYNKMMQSDNEYIMQARRAGEESAGAAGGQNMSLWAGATEAYAQKAGWQIATDTAKVYDDAAAEYYKTVYSIATKEIDNKLAAATAAHLTADTAYLAGVKGMVDSFASQQDFEEEVYILDDAQIHDLTVLGEEFQNTVELTGIESDLDLIYLAAEFLGQQGLDEAAAKNKLLEIAESGRWDLLGITTKGSVDEMMAGVNSFYDIEYQGNQIDADWAEMLENNKADLREIYAAGDVNMDGDTARQLLEHDLKQLVAAQSNDTAINNAIVEALMTSYKLGDFYTNIVDADGKMPGEDDYQLTTELNIEYMTEVETDIRNMLAGYKSDGDETSEATSVSEATMDEYATQLEATIRQVVTLDNDYEFTPEQKEWLGNYVHRNGGWRAVNNNMETTSDDIEAYLAREGITWTQPDTEG